MVSFACEDSISFEEPQPTGKNDFKKIPNKLRGTYISTLENTFLTIDKEHIVEWVDIETKTLADSLKLDIDSAKFNELSTDSIHVIKGKYDLKLRFTTGDSVMIYYSYRDTLFSISKENILRRFKGHYFLNYQINRENWKVRLLTLHEKKLSFSKLGTSGEIEDLKEITEVQEIKSDSGKTVSYKLKPSRRELKLLMKHQFSETKSYRRIE